MAALKKLDVPEDSPLKNADNLPLSFPPTPSQSEDGSESEEEALVRKTKDVVGAKPPTLNEQVLDLTQDKECEVPKDAPPEKASDVGRKTGFVIVVKTSDAGDNDRKPRLTFACEKSGYYRDNRKIKGELLRLTDSKKCGCPFLLREEKLPTNDEWMLHILSGVHNHPSAEHFEEHSFAGRLAKEETSLLVDMSKSMV
ncbi:uncharacterized protein LOC114292293 [Camellia sinensis]|uniref:uncharacterized protein LOC114292293 n=1 Tax=Camellia sinensis TaxID=4442 RepID=UPI0010369046|nr:uncharacterized protein LOC114292293 [Camellia sinensis]